MGYSGLVSHINLSPNCSQRKSGITKITPHHMAGNLSVETCGNIFKSPTRQASSNYGIGSDGRIGLYVDEDNRAWTSSNSTNDHSAVTIEVANSECDGDWPVSDAAWNALVDLCVDICQRNGISGLSWSGDSNGSLTCHYMFTATNCPGPYLTRRMPDLANAVNARLNSGYTPQAPSSEPSGSGSGGGFGGVYRCNVSQDSWLNVRTGPSVSSDAVAKYHRGETVVLDDWYTIADGYVWGRYTAYSGNVRYVAVGKPTGGYDPSDYLVKI